MTGICLVGGHRVPTALSTSPAVDARGDGKKKLALVHPFVALLMFMMVTLFQKEMWMLVDTWFRSVYLSAWSA
jgi:hypothetical protein